MEKLYKQEHYTADTATTIMTMGALAISIANRWMLGWPERVSTLLDEGAYVGCLQAQIEEERDILANEASLRHLSRHEILKLYEIKEAPPLF